MITPPTPELSTSRSRWTPQWFYCAQIVPEVHCNAGMVFGLNPAGNMDQFRANARVAVSLPTATKTVEASRSGSSVFASGITSLRPGEGRGMRKEAGTYAPLVAVLFTLAV